MRRIVKIDEDKCNGCGLCAEACHEGAIVIEDGKAKLIGDSYCDGLGDCLGECPRGAISFEMREAEPYDEAAVNARKTCDPKKEALEDDKLPCGCPGAMSRRLKALTGSGDEERERSVRSARQSQLCNWPIQIKLLPVQAPYLAGADLLIAADCTAFSYPDFHHDMLPGKVCLIGCPKLDDVEVYVEKIAQIIQINKTQQIDVAYMEVPCCGGLVRLVERAIIQSGEAVMLNLKKLSLSGALLEERKIYPIATS